MFSRYATLLCCVICALTLLTACERPGATEPTKIRGEQTRGIIVSVNAASHTLSLYDAGKNLYVIEYSAGDIAIQEALTDWMTAKQPVWVRYKGKPPLFQLIDIREAR